MSLSNIDNANHLYVVTQQDPPTANNFCLIDNIPNTEIRQSNIHGLGLFSSNPISPGMCLCVLDGQIVPYSLYDRQMREHHDKPEVISKLFVEWNALPDSMLLVRMFRTKYSYINHSRKPNCKLIGFPPKLWTIDQMTPGDELTLDYRDEPLPVQYQLGYGSSYL